MSTCLCSDELQEMLDTDCFSVPYQPVVSLKANRIVGFEALARGRRKDETLLMPDALFHHDIPTELRIAADRACRKHALTAFKRCSSRQPDLLLFLNLDESHVPDDADKRGYTHELAKELDLPPEGICLELPAAQLSPEKIETFLSFYQFHGFKFSIDHVGHQVDLLDSLTRHQPDFVKLDRQFHADCECKEHQDARLKLLAEFAAGMGCRVIMLGIEQQDEAVALARQGLHLQQGFYYTKEKNDGVEAGAAGAEMFIGRINTVHKLLKERALDEVRARKESFKNYHRLTGKLTHALDGIRPSGFDPVLAGHLITHPEIVSAFVLDENGMQVTERHHQTPAGKLSAVDKADLAKGGDHSLQDYFIHLSTGYERFVTSPSLSPYTGENSRLICHRLFEGLSRMYIVCVELPEVG